MKSLSSTLRCQRSHWCKDLETDLSCPWITMWWQDLRGQPSLHLRRGSSGVESGITKTLIRSNSLSIYNFKSGNLDIIQGTDKSYLFPLLPLSHRHFYAESTFLCHQASAHMGSLVRKNLLIFLISSFYSDFEFSSGLIFLLSLKAPLCVSCPHMFSEHPMLSCLQSLPIGHCVLLFESFKNHKLFKDWH